MFVHVVRPSKCFGYNLNTPTYEVESSNSRTNKMYKSGASQKSKYMGLQMFAWICAERSTCWIKASFRNENKWNNAGPPISRKSSIQQIHTIMKLCNLWGRQLVKREMSENKCNVNLNWINPNPSTRTPMETLGIGPTKSVEIQIKEPTTNNDHSKPLN